jgi:hypothetical protein
MGKGRRRVRNHWPIIVDEKTNKIVAVPVLFICHGYQAEYDGWALSWKFTARNN